ncbi:MAG: DUF2029 domain-containing protein [bacterium]|nr:DUF2029 domain-containing protein [bacterium]
MRNLLLPVLLLAVLPALYLCHRRGWLERPLVRWLAGIAVLAATVWSLPWQGVEFLYVKRINLLIAAAAALLLVLRHYRVPWTLSPVRRLVALGCLAGLAVVNYCNYFAFHGHGDRVFVHLHDVAHYYLGSKYYQELGYTDLYTAMLRAEAELYDDRFKAIEARDLETYERVHIRTLLQKSERVKAAFTDERWEDFKTDVAYFRQSLDQHYGKVLLDHGFNPTPVWALLGGALAGRVPAGSERDILLLTLLDPLLLLLAFGFVARTFGLETMLLSVIHFCVVFGATFGWTGGAFLRYLWFFGLVAGLCCLHRKRFAAAGALLALATALRVFPLFFLLPLLFHAAAGAWRRRSVPRRYRALFASAAVTGALLFAVTGLLPRGYGHWEEFHANMSRHLVNISPNVVGLTEALAFQPGTGEVTAEELADLRRRRQRIHYLQLAVVFAPLLLLVAVVSRRRTSRGDLGLAVLALPLLYAGLSLAAYYYAFLIVLILAYRRTPRLLALVFAAEAVAYVLMLFEDREALLFVYRGLALAWLYLLLLLDRSATESSDKSASVLP